MPVCKCKSLDRLHGESWIIPDVAFTAGPRPAWVPGKLTRSPKLHGIDLALLGGPGKSESEAAQSSAPEVEEPDLS